MILLRIITNLIKEAINFFTKDKLIQATSKYSVTISGFRKKLKERKNIKNNPKKAVGIHCF